jgi:hypothetical protein
VRDSRKRWKRILRRDGRKPKSPRPSNRRALALITYHRIIQKHNAFWRVVPEPWVHNQFFPKVLNRNSCDSPKLSPYNAAHHILCKHALWFSRRGAGAQRPQAVIRDLFGEAVHAACYARLHYFASKIE